VDLPTLGRDLQTAFLRVDKTSEDSVLVAADAVAIRRRARDGQIALECAACPEQFQVRASVYSQFACVL
jgi:hypothetical protein